MSQSNMPIKKNQSGAEPITIVLTEVWLKALRKLCVATKQKGSNRTAIPDLSQLRGITNVDGFFVPAL